jgi:4-hydroxy-tetrahydrodipicolinate synthase
MRRMVEEPEHRAEIDASLQDVYETLFMTASPTCTKAALNMLGHKVGGLRLPMIEADEHELAAVRTMLIGHGLLSAEGHAAGERKAATSARASGA